MKYFEQLIYTKNKVSTRHFIDSFRGQKISNCFSYFDSPECMLQMFVIPQDSTADTDYTSSTAIVTYLASLAIIALVCECNECRGSGVGDQCF